MDWNEEAIARLRQLWQEGHSTAEIGRRMGITKNAVVGKAHRLVLEARPSPIRRGPPDAMTPKRAPPPRRMSGPTLASLAPRPPAPVPTPAAAAPRPAAPPRAPVQLRAVPPPRPGTRVTACCWPIGEPGTSSFRFCDDAAMTNKPYCSTHAALAYVKVRDRREDAA